jgi:hypothetical protein
MSKSFWQMIFGEESQFRPLLFKTTTTTINATQRFGHETTLFHAKNLPTTAA